MPFVPIDELPPNPMVRVFFSGLMILKSANANCEVFLHRSAPDHHLSIEIRKKEEGKPDVILMRHLGPLTFARAIPPNPNPIHGFILNSATPQGVKSYNGNTPSTEGSKLVGHAFNIGDHHPGKTEVDLPGCRPSIFLDDGVFYSAETTPSDVIIHLKQGGIVKKVLPPIASIIGANIYSNLLTAVWRQNGTIVSLPLKRVTNAVSYEIYITNDPLFEDPALTGTSHEELREYYKILPKIDTVERFTLDFVFPNSQESMSAKRDERGSPRIPCMSIVDIP